MTRALIASTMAEDELQANVLDLCRVFGILVHHCRPARMADGTWRTPISGQPGFPDLVIVGRRGVLYRELKTSAGKPTRDQQIWLSALTGAGADACLWRPGDWLSGLIRRQLEAIR